MLIWVFMFLDIVSLIAITVAHFSVVSGMGIVILLFCATYLSLKAIIFREAMSFIDFGVAIYTVLLILGLKSFVYYLVLAWFLYKIFFVVQGMKS